jgi:hypothetical protein
MPVQVTFDTNDKIVIVKISDKASMDEHHAALEKSLQLCYKKKIKRLLVDLKDVDTKGIVTTASAFKFGKILATDNRLKGVFLAHVLPILPNSSEDIDFISTVASNRGVITKNFTSLEDAKSWLLTNK